MNKIFQKEKISLIYRIHNCLIIMEVKVCKNIGQEEIPILKKIYLILKQVVYLINQKQLMFFQEQEIK